MFFRMAFTSSYSEHHEDWDIVDDKRWQLERPDRELCGESIFIMIVSCSGEMGFDWLSPKDGPTRCRRQWKGSAGGETKKLYVFFSLDTPVSFAGCLNAGWIRWVMIIAFVVGGDINITLKSGGWNLFQPKYRWRSWFGADKNSFARGGRIQP